MSRSGLARSPALARQEAGLAQIRRNLRAQTSASALCDEAAFIENLEQVYRDVWKQWLGRP